MKYIVFLFLLINIVACGSGSSSSGGGNNPTTDTGGSGLSVSGSVTPTSISVDCWASDCSNPPDGTIDQVLTTHTGTLSITVYDIHSQYANVNQGITFTSYTVSYASTTPGAISLPSVSYNNTMQIPLGGATSATFSTTVNVFDLTSKNVFRSGWTGQSLPINYTATIVFYGKDWITNSNITLTTTVAIEVGDFCE